MKNLLLSLFLLGGSSALYAQGSIAVKVMDVKNNDGKIILSLYDQQEGFPSEKEQAFRRIKIDAKKGDMSYTFTNLPYGTYALAVIHDENNDDTVSKNFVGFPKEKIGVSNQTKFGKPSFDKSKFELVSSAPDIEVDLSFLN